MLHVAEKGLHVEGRVLDVMLESFAALAHILDVTCGKSFVLAARNYSYIVFRKRNVDPTLFFPSLTPPPKVEVGW